jgi:hypothetical protein
MARSPDRDRADPELYAQYISSPEWAQRKRRALFLAQERCQYETVDPYEQVHRCPRRRYLAVHHRTYERLGREADDDLEVLCWHHHMVEHLMWQECERCKTTLFEDHEAASAWLAELLAVRRIALDRGPVDWKALPGQFELVGLVGPLCLACARGPAGFVD